MAEQSAFDRNNLENGKLLQPEGILDQLNLPPALIDFLRKYQKPLWIITGVVVAVVVTVSLYSSYRSYTLSKAASELDAALSATTNKQEMLRKVADDYGSTPSAVWARVELAQLAQQNGEIKDAIATFEELKQDVGAQSQVKPLLLTNLGSLYEQENDKEAALGVYGELANTQGFEADAYRAMGRVNEAAGDTEQAVAMYKKYMEIVNEPGSSRQNDSARPLVEARLNRLSK